MSFDPSIFVSLAFLFGIAANFRAMDGYSFLRSLISAIERRLGVLLRCDHRVQMPSSFSFMPRFGPMKD